MSTAPDLPHDTSLPTAATDADEAVEAAVDAVLSAARRALDLDGWAVARLPGLAALGGEARRALVAAAVATLGEPAPATPESPAAGGGGLATDSWAHDAPPRWLALWHTEPATGASTDASTAEPAEPGVGGAVELVDVPVSLVTAAPRDDVLLLRRADVPFAVDGDGEVRWLRMLTPSVVRYRRAALLDGMRRVGWTAAEPLLAAARVVSDAIEAAPRARVTLGPGDVLLIDNHRVVHARTGPATAWRDVDVARVV